MSGGYSSSYDPSIEAAQEDERRKAILRNKISAMFGEAPTTPPPEVTGRHFTLRERIRGDAQRSADAEKAAGLAGLEELKPLAESAKKQFGTEETDLSGALRGQYGDELSQKYADAERAMRFGAANTGNIGSTVYADAQGRLSRDNQLAGTKIEEAVRRAIAGLRSSREDVRGRSIGLVNAGAGEEGVRSATEGLKSAAEAAGSANREQLFNDFFNNLAYTRVAGNQSNQLAQLLAAQRQVGGGTVFPNSGGLGRIIN